MNEKPNKISQVDISIESGLSQATVWRHKRGLGKKDSSEWKSNDKTIAEAEARILARQLKAE